MNAKSTVSAAHEEDSSSANDKLFVQQIRQTFAGVYEITLSAGSAFFLREEYLSHVKAENLCARQEISDEEYCDLLGASVIFAAENAAMTYLSRAEHSRRGLEKKLLAKGIEKSAVESALNFLEGNGSLSDLRFSGAWLRNRAIDHDEGRIRLSAELFLRGVSRENAVKALDDFFRDNDEEEICRRAYKKILKFKSDPEKIRASLMQKGFSLKMINKILREN